MKDQRRRPEHYAPIPLPTLRGFLTFFHVLTFLALGIAIFNTLASAWGNLSWREAVVCLALLAQAGLYLRLVALNPTYPPPRWVTPTYFTSALLLWVLEMLLAPHLFWLGFAFIGQMFGILTTLQALAGTIFVFFIIVTFAPFGRQLLAAPGEFIGWLTSWVSMVILLIYLSHLTRTSRERARLIDELQQAKQELEAAREKEAELAVLRERERLARDMHDTLGHNLVALSVQLEAVQRLYRVDPQAAEEGMDDLKRLTRSSMDELRRTLAGLRTPGLGDRPLKEALQELCVEVSRRSRLRVEFNWEIGDLELPPAVAEALWRTAQEGLTNVEKHAGAGRVKVRLHAGAGELRLQIEDAGEGFLPQDAGRPGHFGLAGMRERLEGVGGRLLIASAPGEGTRLEAHIPAVEAPV